MKTRIIATDRQYQQSPFYISATFDPDRKIYITGQEFKDEEEKKKCALVIDPEESYQIKHLQVFDTDSPVDVELLKLIRTKTQDIASSKNEAIPGVHRFYLENKEDEAKDTISKIEMKLEAFKRIKGLSLDEMVDHSRLVGLHVKNLSKTQVEAGLLNFCENSPEVVLDMFKDNDKDVKIFFKKLVDKGILNFKKGKYVYNEEVIGINEDYAIQYLKDKKNISVVEQWRDKIDKQELVMA